MEEHIGKVIERIQERNTRVEWDNAWEASGLRIGTIAGVTYVCAVLLLYMLGVAEYALSALIPVLGFLLYTLTLPPLKKWWMERYLKREGDE